MAVRIAAMFYATMALAALLMDLGVPVIGLVSPNYVGLRSQVTHFRLDHTFRLVLATINRKHPLRRSIPGALVAEDGPVAPGMLSSDEERSRWRAS